MPSASGDRPRSCRAEVQPLSSPSGSTLPIAAPGQQDEHTTHERPCRDALLDRRGANPHRTHVLVLVQDLDIRIINAATGELLRELVLDPTQRYQRLNKPPGPTPKKNNP